MNHCPGCARGLPLHFGIHIAELEMISCTRSELTLEPMTKDTWHQPEKRLKSEVPFVCGVSYEKASRNPCGCAG